MTGDCRSRECVFAPFQAPTRKVLYHEKRSWRETAKEQAKRGKNTKLKEIKIMLCTIVTAVSVFIGCFFWLPFLATGVHMGRKAYRMAQLCHGGRTEDRVGKGGCGA